jgi:hypothetical protein
VKSSIVERLAEPGSPTQLAVVRVVFAVHLLTVLASPVLPLLREIGAGPHPQAHSLVPATWFDPAWIDWARVVGLIAAATLALGLFTRVAAAFLLAAFVATQGYWFTRTVFHDDWLYFTFYLLVLCFAPSGDAWSLDALRRPPPVRDPRAYRWPIELMIAWFAWNYVAAGLAKILPLQKGLLWLSGEPSQLFAQEFVRDSPIFWLTGHAGFDLGLRWPFVVASLATVIIELGAASMWLSRRAYAPAFIGLLGLHIGIWMLGIPGFVQICVVSGLLLLPASGFARLDARWRDRYDPPSQ